MNKACLAVGFSDGLDNIERSTMYGMYDVNVVDGVLSMFDGVSALASIALGSEKAVKTALPTYESVVKSVRVTDTSARITTAMDMDESNSAETWSLVGPNDHAMRCDRKAGATSAESTIVVAIGKAHPVKGLQFRDQPQIDHVRPFQRLYVDPSAVVDGIVPNWPETDCPALLTSAGRDLYGQDATNTDRIDKEAVSRLVAVYRDPHGELTTDTEHEGTPNEALYWGHRTVILLPIDAEALARLGMSFALTREEKWTHALNGVWIAPADGNANHKHEISLIRQWMSRIAAARSSHEPSYTEQENRELVTMELASAEQSIRRRIDMEFRRLSRAQPEVRRDRCDRWARQVERWKNLGSSKILWKKVDQCLTDSGYQGYGTKVKAPDAVSEPTPEPLQKVRRKRKPRKKAASK